MYAFFIRFTLIFVSLSLAFTCLFNGVDKAGSSFEAQSPDDIRLNFAVVSDLHSASETKDDRNISNARTFAGMSKSKTPLDAVVLPGDLTNNGTRHEYRNLAAILNRYVRRSEIIPAIGNHDARGDMAVEDHDTNMQNYYTFCDIMGVDASRPYWSAEVNGYTFIALGSETEEKDRAFVSDEQIEWLDATLTEADSKELPVFIVCHQVIDHTNNVDNVWWYDGSIGERSDEVRDVIRSHTDAGTVVLYISGHLHQSFCEYSFEQPWPNLYCLNMPSVVYNDDGGKGCMVEVYPDSVLVRTRDFIAGKWLDGSYTIPLG